MAIQLGDIASLVDGHLIGDAGLVCHGASPLGEAAADEVTMLDDSTRVESILESAALAVITSREVDLEGRPQIVVLDPHQAFAKLVAHFRPPIDQAMPAQGIDPTAEVADSAVVHPSALVGAGVKIGERTRIMPGAVIMPRSKIGDDCVLHANVTLYEYTSIADRVVIHASTVIGANGFGYRQEAGRHIPSAQLGYVCVESDVEIGASVTIDRGTYGATRIGEGTKIDNQVMIGHNCQIGRHNLLCSQVGIAGSCRTGDYVILAGQVGLKDHITLGDHTIVGAQAGVMDDCPGNEVYLGSPATIQRDQMQIMAVERRLPEMRRELKKLRRELEQWKQNEAAQLAEQDSGVETSSRSNSNQDQRGMTPRRGYWPRRSHAILAQHRSRHSRPPIGLIAGWGSFPVQVAQSLIRDDQNVCCIAISGHASSDLESICDHVLWSGVGKLGGHIRYFRRNGVRQMTMAGKLFKADLLYHGSLWLRHLPDLTCIRTLGPSLVGRKRDARDDSLMLAITNAYDRAGIEVCAPTDFAPELLVNQGLLTGPAPGTRLQSDIQAGWRVAKQMGGMDIGQSITIKDGTVVAVEAIEGTDACIDRTGQLCRRGGWTLVKVSKPNQDMRFDVPTIGPQTIARVQQAGGTAIAVEAGKTIVVEQAKTFELARKAGITIVAIDDAQATGETDPGVVRRAA